MTDPASSANFDEITIQNLALKWLVDFDVKKIGGSAELTVVAKVNDVSQLILDSSNLSITKVTVDGSEAKFAVEPHAVQALGSKLTIALPVTNKLATRKVLIEYSTSENATALQWMAKEQTADRAQPYLFSQCQAIHARSIVPCMDTPSVKHPYQAEVSVPEKVVALMSAVAVGEATPSADRNGYHVYKFEQKVPIASYLIAIVVGRLTKRDLSKRCAVWAEPSVIEKAAYEFIKTEDMLQAGEQLLGPYVWGRYDILLLPPSFPYGGMENPCLTFVTPTLIAGDRSLTDVIAHEIAHSWTGNLVSNGNWQHMWLNEGFTVFVERKIVGRLHGEEMRQFDAQCGWEDRLLPTIFEVFNPTHEFTKLIQNQTGIDPDDAFSGIPYEKGSAFLMYLEQQLGGPEVFEAFLLNYVNKFAYESILTDQWKTYLFDYFGAQKSVLEGIDFDAWLNNPGVPPNKPTFNDALMKVCIEVCKQWVDADENSVKDIEAANFLRLLPAQKTKVLDCLRLESNIFDYKVERMEELYHLNSVGNSERLFSWIRLAIRARWAPILDVALKFVTDQGRMKFVRPIYKDLVAWDVAASRAKETFIANRPFMHPITATMVAKDLGL
uniref:Peptidase M1 leukotriene A4 hydrolase/aminopeptidase C-terminal domain-containing protein n=1 Tax=Plectus sambesii TaxID=2011161 RepID=A0A914WEU3_9BILA